MIRVSKLSFVAPSKVRPPSSLISILLKLAAPDSKPYTSETKLLNSTLNCSRVAEVVTSEDDIDIIFYPIKFLTYL